MSQMNETLYKYKGLDNFKHFVDIILNNRLYAARYQELNDPMEGQYYYITGELNKDVRNKLRDDNEVLRLCSLSKVRDNHLMWSHYANGQRGVSIGLRIKAGNGEVRPIQYDGLASIREQDFNHQTAIDILSHKLEVWNYEQEVRVFVKNKLFVYIEIVEVITGLSMKEADFRLVRDLVRSINPKILIIKAETFMH